jgi:hypothetical protein
VLTTAVTTFARMRRSRLRTAIIRNAQRLIVVLLVLIVSSIVGPGVFVLLPELFPTTTAAYMGNLVLTGWLVFNVVFNLIAATVKPAGVAHILAFQFPSREWTEKTTILYAFTLGMLKLRSAAHNLR